MDHTRLTDDELEQLRSEVAAEIARRYAARDVSQSFDGLARDQLERAGRKPGDTWIQPTAADGPNPAYPLGWVVTHQQHQWESLISANVTEPGNPTDGQAFRWWRDLGPSTTQNHPARVHDDTAPDTWSGSGVTYQAGARVSFDHAVYQCRQAHQSQADWTPIAVPALWQRED